MALVSVTEAQVFTACSSRRFAALVAEASPFRGVDDLIAHAREVWWQRTGVPGWLEAFAAHPKIGERHREASAFGAMSSQEQAAAASTSTTDLASELRDFNVRYFDKFGHIFIICAKGRSTPEILASLKSRLGNSPHEELANAAREQMAITEQRLRALMAAASAEGAGSSAAVTTAPVDAASVVRRTENVLGHLVSAQPTAAAAPGAPLRSPITTHVLDTSLGVPARGLHLALFRADAAAPGGWAPVNEGTTNDDGRVGTLMAPSNIMPAGHYKMTFDTGGYFARCRALYAGTASSSSLPCFPEVPFYPKVDVEFVVAADKTADHYHIPLLLSPFGFSTYKGS